MSLRDMAAQMVWPNLMGDYVAADAPQWRRLASYVRDDKVGGLLISVGSPIEIAAKLNALQELSGLPLLVGADLEAGAGMRARGGYFVPNGIDLGGATLFPTEMALGATGDSALAYAQGRVTATEGRALGIHVDFAPVLDVNNNPANPVINTRSYGEDPLLDGRLGAAFIAGVQDNGMIATGKHFPGHGDTGLNSHLTLPVVTVSRARLDSVELVPFRRAIQAGVGAIMSFHGSMPALDSTGVPGTLSRNVLTTLLRQELGFQGIIVSDAMDMRGVLVQFGAKEAVKRAVAAGIDVLIQPADVHETIDAILEGAHEGRYTDRRIAESARRILLAKQHLGLDHSRLVSLDSVRNLVGDSAHRALALTIARRSITLVRDSASLVPLHGSKTARVLSITIARRPDLEAGAVFNAALRNAFPALQTEFVDVDAPSPDIARLERLADSASVIIIGSYIGQRWDAVSASAPQRLMSFVQGLGQRGRAPVVISFGNPYLLQQIPTVSTYLAAWSSSPASQEAAAEAILGAIPIVGRLPISIPPLVTRGAGLTR